MTRALTPRKSQIFIAHPGNSSSFQRPELAFLGSDLVQFHAIASSSGERGTLQAVSRPSQRQFDS
jgi:hypothetical protein